MPTTLVTVPQSNLAAGARFSSVPTPGAVALPADCTSLTCSLSMSAADQTDAGKAVTWTVWVAPPGPAPTSPPPTDGSDQGNGWRAVAKEAWRGGTHTAHDGTTGVPNATTFTESIDPTYRGGWVAADGSNTGTAFNGQSKVGCSVTSNP